MLRDIFKNAPLYSQIKNNILFNSEAYICLKENLSSTKTFNDLTRVYINSVICPESTSDSTEILVSAFIRKFDDGSAVTEILVEGYYVYPVFRSNRVITNSGLACVVTDPTVANIQSVLISEDDFLKGFSLAAYFNINEIFSAAFSISGDLFFRTKGEAKAYSEKIHITSGKINLNYAIVDTDKYVIYFDNYYMFENSQLLSFFHKNFFNYLCRNIKDKGFSFSREFKINFKYFAIINNSF